MASGTSTALGIIISTILKTIIIKVPSQMGAGTGHWRWKAEDFLRKFKAALRMPHTVRSTVAKHETWEVMASGTSAAWAPPCNNNMCTLINISIGYLGKLIQNLKIYTLGNNYGFRSVVQVEVCCSKVGMQFVCTHTHTKHYVLKIFKEFCVGTNR